jgi:hypothetical protein
MPVDDKIIQQDSGDFTLKKSSLNLKETTTFKIVVLPFNKLTSVVGLP